MNNQAIADIRKKLKALNANKEIGNVIRPVYILVFQGKHFTNGKELMKSMEGWV